MANNSDPIVKVFSLVNSWYKYHLLSVGVFLFVFVCAEGCGVTWCNISIIELIKLQESTKLIITTDFLTATALVWQLILSFYQ